MHFKKNFAVESFTVKSFTVESGLGPDRNSGSGEIWAGSGSGSGRFGRYQTGTAIFFSCWIIGFLCFALIVTCITCPYPAPWLDHVHLSSSQTVSCATLQIPDCITCPLQFLAVSRAPLQFQDFSTFYTPVPKMYHVSTKSILSTTLLYHVPPPPLYPFWRHLER